jgi:hypothetical protein
MRARTVEEKLIVAPYCMLVHLGSPEGKEVFTDKYCHPMLHCSGEPSTETTKKFLFANMQQKGHLN